MRPFWVRLVVVLTVLTGANYVAWRWLASLNWDAWWIAVPLVIAETYSLIDVMLFGMTVWRLKTRTPPSPAPADATVDVFITTYNEPLDMVMTTALAAQMMEAVVNFGRGGQDCASLGALVAELSGLKD